LYPTSKKPLEYWDIETKSRVELPNPTSPHLVQHSSYAGASKLEIAIMAMPVEAREKYARFLYTIESIMLYSDEAERKGLISRLPSRGPRV